MVNKYSNCGNAVAGHQEAYGCKSGKNCTLPPLTPVTVSGENSLTNMGEPSVTTSSISVPISTQTTVVASTSQIPPTSNMDGAPGSVVLTNEELRSHLQELCSDLQTQVEQAEAEAKAIRMKNIHQLTENKAKLQQRLHNLHKYKQHG